MENALNVAVNRLKDGVLAMPLSAGKRLDQTAVLDIAALAARAVEHPGELAGQRIDLASDSLTGAEMAGILTQVLGRTIPYQQLPTDMIWQRAGNEIAKKWPRPGEARPGPPACRSVFRPPTRLDSTAA